MGDRKRVTKVVVITDNAHISNGMLKGVKVKTSFTVSLNEEDKKTGVFGQVVDMLVDFEGTPIKDVVANAWANKKVAMANPLRNLSYQEIEGLSGQTIHFTEAGKKIESEETRQAKNDAYIASLTPLGKIQLAIKSMEEAGMEVPEAVLEQEYQLKHQAD